MQVKVNYQRKSASTSFLEFTNWMRTVKSMNDCNVALRWNHSYTDLFKDHGTTLEFPENVAELQNNLKKTFHTAAKSTIHVSRSLK